MREINCRWQSECEIAARHAGYEPVDVDGIEDYQGWGVFLLRKVKDEGDALVALDAEREGRVDDSITRLRNSAWTWAAMGWSYGSCSGCDSYEDQVYGYPDRHADAGPGERAERMFSIFGELIEPCDSEESARLKFSERKGW